jgi:septum formation protein
MGLVLASTSPRRIQLVETMGLEFTTIDPQVNEAVIVTPDPEATSMARAEAKALAGASMRPDDVVVAADTVVVLEGRILDKAVDGDEVRKMLGLLSGKEHHVITSIAVCFPGIGDALVRTDVAAVTFKELDDAAVEWYVGTGEGVGKAGGYAVQGMGGMLVETLEGDKDTVIGLPTTLLSSILKG